MPTSVPRLLPWSNPSRCPFCRRESCQAECFEASARAAADGAPVNGNSADRSSARSDPSSPGTGVPHVGWEVVERERPVWADSDREQPLQQPHVFRCSVEWQQEVEQRTGVQCRKPWVERLDVTSRRDGQTTPGSWLVPLIVVVFSAPSPP